MDFGLYYVCTQFLRQQQQQTTVIDRQ